MVDRWQLHIVRQRRSKRKILNPILENWTDLESREHILGVGVGQPILLSPSGRPDRDVFRYLNSISFRMLSDQSQRSYATDMKVYFNYLHSQMNDWRSATTDDFLNYEFWRRRDPNNPRKISGSKFSRELAALYRFYAWQIGNNVIDRNPIQTKMVRRRNGSFEQSISVSPTNIRRSNVKWLTSKAYRRWRDVGLGGYSSDGLRDKSWRGRNDGRNVAFADALWSSGLRLNEGASLLIFEVPQSNHDEKYIRGRVGEAVAKGGSKRDFWISRNALDRIENYINFDRNSAIERARSEGRYEELSGIIIAEKVNRKRELIFKDKNGHKGSLSLDEINQTMRAKIFYEGNQGIEPASLWLTEYGMPLLPSTWEAVFRAANLRCVSQKLPIYCHPHMLRHSFALKMLVTLIHVFDRRMGLSPEERREFRMLFGDPWVLVQTMLGHRSSETTRDIYLEPVTGLQVDFFLNDQQDDEFSINTLLSRIAAASPYVKDI